MYIMQFSADTVLHVSRACACYTRRQVTHSTRYQVYVCTYQVYVSEEKQSKINVARRRHVVGWPRNNNTMVINGA